jgi:hypothetical protein
MKPALFSVLCEIKEKTGKIEIHFLLAYFAKMLWRFLLAV